VDIESSQGMYDEKGRDLCLPCINKYVIKENNLNWEPGHTMGGQQGKRGGSVDQEIGSVAERRRGYT